MGNKLKNVFSSEEISFNEKLNFRDQESYEQFIMALETVQEEGKPVQVKGIDSVEMLIRSGKSVYPIAEHNNICDFVVEPQTEKVSLELDTDYGKKRIDLKRYQINKGIVLQTSEKAIVFLKIFFEKDTMKSKISYHIQLENAKNVKELIESHSIILSFFNKLFREDIDNMEDGITIKDMKKYFEKAIEGYKKLEYVEEEFGIAFDPKILSQNEECWVDLEEIFLTLKEKEVIRLNAKVHDMGSVGMNVNQQVENIKVGAALDVTFIVNIDYSLWNINITLFAASLLSNAIVKEINKEANGEIKILYSDEDSRPMYISYRGFKTEEEAKEEMKNIMNHKDEYINALTVTGHINKRISESK